MNKPEGGVNFKSQNHLPGHSNFPLCLAPMVGMSHVALRAVVREYLPKDFRTIWPTEMLSSWKIPRECLEITNETKRDPDETGLVPQILGNEEEPIKLTVEKLISWGAEGIDINMGCPVQKALRHNYGVALMGDAKYAADVVAMTKKNSSVPISVKLRAGIQNDFSYLQNFTEGLVDSGADWITLHPRTAEQKRRGQADWSQIKKLKSVLKVPVIGNGDIQCAADVFAMLDETGCDMVMAGRALAAKPWMMAQVARGLGGLQDSEIPHTPEEEAKEYGKSLLRLIYHMRRHFSEEQALRKFRFHVRMTSVWLDFGHAVVSLSHKEKTLAGIESTLPKFFDQNLKMFVRTDLRE